MDSRATALDSTVSSTSHCAGGGSRRLRQIDGRGAPAVRGEKECVSEGFTEACWLERKEELPLSPVLETFERKRGSGGEKGQLSKEVWK